MDQIYITDIKIDHVRHLKNIEIPLSENHMKHLIITGKNGSLPGERFFTGRAPRDTIKK